MGSLSVEVRTEVLCGRICDLEAENAKLRELVGLMWKPFCWAQSYGACLTDEQDAEIRDKVRELGVDA